MRGTPEEHWREAGLRAKTARNALQDARDLLRQGSCVGALDALRIADRAQARLLEEKAWTGRNPGSVSSKALITAWRKFSNKCPRNR
jgi:hypothetical protein